MTISSFSSSSLSPYLGQEYHPTSPDMSPTSLGNPRPADGRSANGHPVSTGRDKSTSLRSAAAGDGSAGKNGGERVWRSGIVTAGEKLKGEEGQRVVVTEW